MQEVTFEINNIEELSKVSELLIDWRDYSNIVAFYGNIQKYNPIIIVPNFTASFLRAAPFHAP